MTKISTEVGLLSKKQRKEAIDRIIAFFETERDEEIGVIAAEDVLEMFLDTVGKDLYNKGVQEASDYVRDRNEQILLDLEALLKKS